MGSAHSLFQERFDKRFRLKYEKKWEILVNHAEKNLIYFNNAGTEKTRERKEGNIIGNPIEPVIKLSANPLTCSTMGEHTDLDYKQFVFTKL